MSYTPFKAMEAKLANKPGVTSPGGLAHYLAAKKYGNKALETAAKNGTSLRHAKKKRKSKAIAAFIKAPK